MGTTPRALRSVRPPAEPAAHRRLAAAGLSLRALALASCSSRPEPVATPLVDHFKDATVASAVVTKEGPPRIDWHFDGESKGIATKEGSPIRGWKAVQDVRGLAIRDRCR